MRYILHEDARTDLVEAASFYREQAGVRLSQAFLDEFESAAKNLIQHPRLGGIWRNGRRRFLMSRFPYSLIYDVSDERYASMPSPTTAVVLRIGENEDGTNL